MRTFKEGADGVVTLGCHIGECRYSTGNHRAARRIPVLKLPEFIGIEPERFLAKWAAASGGGACGRVGRRDDGGDDCK
jgi:F420-non-reducing hydrogenase iron-sulfur subunit